MGGIAWPLRNPVEAVGGAAEVFTAKASGVVRADSVQPVPVDAKVNGRPVFDFEVAAVRGDETPRWSAAVVADGQPCYLTAPATPGRYRLLCRRGGTVVVAGTLART